MSIYSFGLLLLVSLFSTSLQAGQTCRSDLDISTPTSRFIFNNNGTVTDTKTDITWMRCALGQKWNGKTCTGDAQNYNWQEAREISDIINFEEYAESTSWRLPYVPELASIVERKCFTPRVNLVVFPATPSKLFWTGMAQKGNTDKAYAIDFGGGSITASKKTYAGFIRLMHDGPKGPWWEKPQAGKK